MRAADLTRKLEDRPFKPFRIHLLDGTLLDVQEPGMVIVGMSSAVLPKAYGVDEDGRRILRDWRTVALSHIVQFTDLRDHGRSNGRRRKAS